MKRMLIILTLLCSPLVVKADDSILTQFIKAFTEHGNIVTQSEIHGKSHLAYSADVIPFAKFHTQELFDLQIAVNGNMTPTADQVQSADWLGAAQFRVDSLLKDYVTVPPYFEFLKSIKHGPTVYYDTRDGKGYFVYQIGVQFIGLQTNQTN